GEICFTAEDSETFDGYGLIRLDIEGLELHYETGFLAEAEDETVIPDWGPGFAQIIPHSGTESYVARFEDGAELWRVNEDELFEVERTSPPEHVEFMRIGDLALIQGYQPILETLEIEQPHTLSLDFATSRTLVAVDAATGEVAWRLPGGDALCHAVHERPVPSDTTTI